MNRDIVVVAHDIRSCHNVGSIFRTCEGLGIQKLYLSGYTPYPQVNDDPRLPHEAKKISRQIHKTALGAEESLVWQHHTQPINVLLTELKDEGYEICALEQAPDAIMLNDYLPSDKIVLLLGREVEGIDSRILRQCDQIIEIPMLGLKESFNVVQAAAITLYRLRFLP